MRRQGLSASRIRQAVVLLRQMLEAAVRDGMVGRNACAGVKLPKLTHNEAAYSEPQTVDAIAEAVGEPYGRLVSVLGTCGLRWGEAAALRRRHIDVLRHRLLVEESLAEVSGQLIFGSTKSHTHRSVPVPKTLMKRLAVAVEDKGPEELVFTSPQGKPLRYRNFLSRVWHPTLKRLGLSVVGIHTLRHSAAARIVAAGGSAKTLQVVLGHRSAGFSLTTYAHLFDADLDDLGERLETSRVKSVSRLEDYRRSENRK
jgi:integrase